MRRPEGRPPADAVLRAAVALGRALRDAGLGGLVDRELLFCHALAEVDPRRRSEVYWAASAAFLRDPGERARFDAVFERFWEGRELEREERGPEHGESDPRMTGPQHGGASLPQLRQEGRASTLLDGGMRRATRELPSASGRDERRDGRDRRGLLAAYSPARSSTEPEPLEYVGAELAAIRRLAHELRRAAPERRSRRLRASRRGGRLDLRRTLRRSLGTAGEPLHPAWAAPSPRPRRLLLLCDVSGSMERHSRVLLGALGAAVGGCERAEAFVFATGLTRLTRALSGRDLERTLERARAAVEDWSGGTRIGETLAAFNRSYGRRGFARGAIVVVVSDGWDRGDPELLARELRRLQLQSRRLVWVNPRPAPLAAQPLATGMRAALPYVDDFVPGHDPAALVALAPLIGGLGARPARRSMSGAHSGAVGLAR